MSEAKASTDADADMAVEERIAFLLNKIEKEPVPQRLLELAQQLQEALNARKK
ncbi:hypothetical protein NGR_b18760 (plasmid) [Sinorhizobium fredii NGR234]|uniref:Anti-sigma factor NepR domain-containing protein n=1 Tax=Sinorhizobium fredii (strain NBRC 101917 / NGR234) TaxID=394 RepID=C3KLN7_SINFN|nr:hypothetical protein [Sinorhizobium fredii]ACP23323.1 hypothetical protein NGR_b18760 [Sinorhizobium fredii NGR234]